MSTQTAVAPGLIRIAGEGYGDGAWHGPDLKAALSDVNAAMAFERPAAGRHNIAEIALHHAYCVRAVREKLSGTSAAPFVLEGDDWFALDDASRLSWLTVQGIVDKEQAGLKAVVGDLAAGRAASPLPDDEQLTLVLGITCHAVYHAGQIQLIKKLNGN